ncbi:lysozyme [Hyphomonas sp.]|uniref:lysozyme n=1 Tax=Hyphomonas sp. TaxID=87 RepID=UPI0030029219
MTMKTTPGLISFLQLVETGGKFRPVAYDDRHPDRVLQPGDPVEGRLTYGTGHTTRPDGSALQIGDEITPQEDLDRLHRYVREEVEPVIENLVHVPLWPEAYDAIGSIIFNFGAGEVSGWRLWRRINAGEPWSNIAIEWVTGTFYDDDIPLLGLWRRRIMEVLMFFKLEWRVGANVGWNSDVIKVMNTMGWEGDQPKPVTTEDLNTAQLEDLEDKARETGAVVVREAKAKVAVKTAKSPIPVDHIEYLDDEAKAEVKVKKVKDSQRGKGFAKQEVAKTVSTVAVSGMIAEQVGAVEPVMKFVNAYSYSTIGIVFGGLTVFAVIYYFYGKWQEQKGRDDADTLLG